MEWLVLLGKFVSWIVGATAVFAATGFAYELISEHRDKRTPPGELVSVSGRAMHLLCQGSQSTPAVILEAGGGRSSTTSREIQSKLAEFASSVHL